MKHVTLLLLVIAGLMLGCEKDEDGKLSLKTKMSASIDGQEWESVFRLTNRGENSFEIIATDKLNKNEGKQLVITIRGLETGTYTLSATEASGECAAVYKPDAATDDETTYYLSVSGTVNLTEVDEDNKTISGDFQFEVKNSVLGESISISNGSFTDLKYTSI